MSWDYTTSKEGPCECGRGFKYCIFGTNDWLQTSISYHDDCDYCNPKIVLSEKIREQIDSYKHRASASWNQGVEIGREMDKEYEQARIVSGERKFKTREASMKQRGRLLTNPLVNKKLVALHEKLIELEKESSMYSNKANKLEQEYTNKAIEKARDEIVKWEAQNKE
ncbi:MULTISPECIES: hypothetical protein [Bacillus]|uniref:hypothetical protein n=1 Tax=Bacillus TaxID=1386 RepID=UPI0005D3BE6A|nr:hypothetical protein [Bacillus altitudinis]KQL39151.1 hypothetical protein AN962_16670 [Bacillus sp. FJAT-21955]KJF45931.1 hypothetical protein BAIE_18200 [Bacillus altitudinis]MBU8654468.1 hypothetical protein [Bacillus altitudinis]MBU8779937.1 hypothetical protein [Bacillus altitudinis]NMF14980.1 hypothetical protein [Bacillus altitudinis]